MDKISVLMNCFNGEKYLEEAILSVYNQSYNNWEIIFIDNCSTDGSATIAKSFSEKLKYFKTSNNIRLGAARKFGVEKCGNYIAVLDSDDVWMPNMLEVLYKSINSGDYSLSYGNQFQINSEGKIISKIKNRNSGQVGNFFPKLLMQFDIPMVCCLIDKRKMLKMNLNFDENIYGSEEYCLFMQMAINSKFISVDDFLVKYRVHDSLTTQLNIKIVEDRIYTLNKIISENPKLNTIYQKEFREAFARAKYYKAQFYVNNLKKEEAIKEMKKIMFLDIKYFSLTMILILPGLFFWNFFQKVKYGR